jgi:hypothetical protein
MTLKSGSYSSELSIPGTKEVQTHANTDARQKNIERPTLKSKLQVCLALW